MIYAFFPIIAAVFYGLAYIFIEKSMESINVATFVFVSGVFGVISSLFLWFIRSEAISMAFLSDKSGVVATVIAATALPAIGWVLTIYAVEKTSASYTSFMEISYPLFTLLFLFLFFGVRHFDWTIMVGGGLMMLGSFILIYGQSSPTQN